MTFIFILLIEGLFFISPFLLLLWFKTNNFNKTIYRQETGNSFLKVLVDKGLAGEYYTAKILDKLPGYHKMLINAYIPKEKGGTTELDILFLHKTGLYVIESKNYSGWIFGKESNKNWMQTLPNGHKERFYNPIKQNRGHIKALKTLLPDIPEHQFTSMIIFSERCKLKKITVDSPDILVFKRNHLACIMNEQVKNSTQVLTNEQINKIYQTIKPHTNVSASVKQSHIEKIKQSS